MASGLPDLSKQVGPLPLGAWVAVVGTGVGIAVYQRRTTAPSTVDPTQVPDDTSGTPGVGVGGSGQWVNVDPPSTSDTPTTYSTNEEWGTAAINYLIAHNYSPTMADSAIRKYIGGDSSTLSVQEWALVTVALGALKSPPQLIPPSTSPPVVGGGTTPPAAKAVYRMQWVSAKSGVTQTLRDKQIGQARQASSMGVWKPSSASLNSVISQACIRNAKSPNSVIKAGQWVVLYMPVKVSG